MLRDHSGDAAVEWLVLAGLVIAVVGGALLAIFESLRVKLAAINEGL